jgi:purine-binding chemotaxis protein CheW
MQNVNKNSRATTDNSYPSARFVPESQEYSAHPTNTAEDILLARAKELARSQRRTTRKIDIRCIEFVLAGMNFAFEMHAIREIMRNSMPITPLPFLPKSFLGLINVRGEVVPVIDLAHYLGLSRPKAAKEVLTSLIILQKKDVVVAFPCERIVRIREFSHNELQPTIAAQSQVIASLAKGCGRGGITLLDADAFMLQLQKSLNVE